MGSSVGVHKVIEEGQFQPAIDNALTYSHKIVIEAAIVGREVECAVLGNHHPEASPVGEIRSNHTFYSYEAKYLDPYGAEIIIPADLPKHIVEQIQKLALQAFQALECRGLARVDFFVTDNFDIFVSEVNTLPGFTSISMYPKLWEYAGLSYSHLITQLIEFGWESYLEKKKISLHPCEIA